MGLGIKTRLKRYLTARLAAGEGAHAASPAIHRASIAAQYLHGEGLEVGALHRPLPVPPGVRVRYVDRLPVHELRRHYPELEHETLVVPDILDDAGTLATVADASQDFVIANHLLEHCPNPIAAMHNLLRVLRPGGVLFLALPDKRLSFDRDRPLTPFEHLERDYHEGPHTSRDQHFEEWTRLVNKITEEAEARSQIEHYKAIDYSIHYHVWDQMAMLEFLSRIRGQYTRAFDIELMWRCAEEVVFVLRV